MIPVEQTPNPNALKFTVGEPVGGPVTYRSADETDDERIRAIFNAGGGQIFQVFLTADFISVTKSEDADWEFLVPRISAAIESGF